ncbi:MAG: L-threonylcarbamoyladenylate synthase [Phycisphaerales bacterium]|jgi:L-threonylcarbamoyladenylate synthase|nr:L-threonylcarbamoyladenylate synthase [Phycisphaerales bacterium]
MVDVRQGDHQTVQEAGRRLRQGGLVVIPTETVYGLAACTMRGEAVSEIFTLKGRPGDNPLIAHVLDVPMARTITASWPPQAAALAEAFWPGPLTMVLPRNPAVPAVATAGLDTIAVRSPRHPIAQAILQAAGQPLSAPSANRSGCVSPTRAAHVQDDYAGVAAAERLLVVDGGPCEEGLESTVVDLSGDVARVLRCGTVGRDAIKAVIGSLSPTPPPQSQDASPGTRHRHYAPRKDMVCCQRAAVASVLASGDPASVIALADVPVPPPHTHLALPDNPPDAGAALYDLLRQADAASTSRVVAVIPDRDGWAVIQDRLRRGAAG